MGLALTNVPNKFSSGNLAYCRVSLIEWHPEAKLVRVVVQAFEDRDFSRQAGAGGMVIFDHTFTGTEFARWFRGGVTQAACYQAIKDLTGELEAALDGERKAQRLRIEPQARFLFDLAAATDVLE